MNILAIESSGLVASAAVLEDDLLKTEFTVNNRLTHSETLLPMIRQMFDISGLDMKHTDAIAVSAGPGSFTGLRIGAATAKGLAMALNVPVISVSSLQAMAYELCSVSDAIICPIMDARREQVYSAAYQNGATVLVEEARDIHEFIALLNEQAHVNASAGYSTESESLDPDVSYIFIGDGVPVYSDIIADELEGDVSFAGAAFNRQRAVGVAELGALIFKDWLIRNNLSAEAVHDAGADGIDCYDDKVMNLDDFAPLYLRKTQAERELKAGILGDPGKHSLSKMQDKGTPRHQ